jgi:hypothetical protein
MTANVAASVTLIEMIRTTTAAQRRRMRFVRLRYLEIMDAQSAGQSKFIIGII